MSTVRGAGSTPRVGGAESELDEDLRTTAEAIRADALRVGDIEEQKLALDADDPRLAVLAEEAEIVAERMLTGTRVERLLVEEHAASNASG